MKGLHLGPDPWDGVRPLLILGALLALAVLPATARPLRDDSPNRVEKIAGPVMQPNAYIVTGDGSCNRSDEYTCVQACFSKYPDSNITSVTCSKQNPLGLPKYLLTPIYALRCECGIVEPKPGPGPVAR